jgi:predicted NUDIX family NTP pyrophosphohydrolase
VESAGLLLFRLNSSGDLEVLLGHMGGPFWSGKPRSWSIPKGLREASDSDALAAAEREFAEEMGTPAPTGESTPLGSVRLSNKTVTIFARPGTFDASAIRSNTFSMEWPPRSGRMQDFPEMDRAAWVSITSARDLIVASQAPFLDRLLDAAAQGPA